MPGRWSGPQVNDAGAARYQLTDIEAGVAADKISMTSRPLTLPGAAAGAVRVGGVGHHMRRGLAGLVWAGVCAGGDDDLDVAVAVRDGRAAVRAASGGSRCFLARFPCGIGGYRKPSGLHALRGWLRGCRTSTVARSWPPMAAACYLGLAGWLLSAGLVSVFTVWSLLIWQVRGPGRPAGRKASPAGQATPRAAAIFVLPRMRASLRT